MSQDTKEDVQLWAAQSLVHDLVQEVVRRQLSITQELSPCAQQGHDTLLPEGHTILRPSLTDGVGVFWGHTLLHLRRFFAPEGTIDDLLKILDRIVREGALLPGDCELVAEENWDEPDYEGDGKGYMIYARYKQPDTP